MKYSVCLLIAVTALLAGCASNGSILGIATTKYVDLKMEERDARMLETDQKIDATSLQLEKTSTTMNEDLAKNQQIIDDAVLKLSLVEEDLGTIRTRAEDLDNLIAEFTNLKKTTADLQAFNEKVQEKLDALPRETIRQLVAVLQDFLNAEASGEPGSRGTATPETQPEPQAQEAAGAQS